MKSRILETAKELFVKEGYKKVSIRSIADKIEYSPGTLYLYFKDKNEILFALQEEGFERLYQQQQALNGIQDPMEKLREHGVIYVSFGLDHPEYYDLMFIMRGPADKINEMKKWDAGERTYQYLRDNVKACIDAGRLKAKDLDSAAFAMWAFVHGIVSIIIRKRSLLFSCPERELRHFARSALDCYFENLGGQR